MSISVKRTKLRLGLTYGMVAGFAFSFFAWGVDAILLALSNSTYAWVKFLSGMVLSVVIGGLVGWLTIRFEKHGIAIFLWGLLAFFYSWLAVWIPFTGRPYFIKILDSNLAQFFHFHQVVGLAQYRWVSLAAIGLASIICGVLEINLVSQGTLSSHGFASFSSILVCVFLFGVAGSAADQMISSPLREPVQVVNSLIQFAANNFGVEVPRQTARKLHLSAANQLGELVLKDRRLTLVGFDKDLGIMDVLVNFEGILSKCSTIYGQPTDCIILTQNP